MSCEEARELITALVDDELSTQERHSIESHLKGCLKCQSVYAEERRLKREIRLVSASISAPPRLRARILSDCRIFLQVAESPKEWRGLVWPMRPILLPALALVLLVLLALPTLYLMWPTAQPIALVALKTHEGILSGSIPFTKVGSQEEMRELLVRSVEGRFAPLGYDLSVMNLKAVGGFVQEVGERKILVTVYEGRDLIVSCFTFLGTEEDAPSDFEVLFDPETKINFYTTSRAGANAVFHRRGEVICILVSKMPMQDLLALARSKA